MRLVAVAVFSAGLSVTAVAQEATDTSNASSAPAPAGENQPAAPALHQQTVNRSDKTFTLAGTYGLYSFLVPGKKGFQLTYLHDSRWTYEADYFSGDWGLNKYGINLVSLSERLTTFKVRKYWASSFNLTAGFGERRLAFELGSAILEKIPSNVIPKSTLIEIKRYVLTFGIGNRWHFPKGFTVGADWFEIAAPVGKARVQDDIVDSVQDEDDRKNSKKAVDYLANLPTVNVVKISMGYSF